MFSTSWLLAAEILLPTFKPSALQQQEAAKSPTVFSEQSEKLGRAADDTEVSVSALAGTDGAALSSRSCLQQGRSRH